MKNNYSKQKLKIIISCIFTFIFVMPLFCSIFFGINTQNTLADDIILNDNNQNSTNYSIFINEPTFSFVYAENLYYFDSFDNILKVYNLQNNTFHSTYLDMQNYGTLIDATICENYIFALFYSNEKYSIHKINLDLDDFSTYQITNNDELKNLNFSKIHTTQFNDNYYITLTPKINSETFVLENTNYPIILVNKKSENTISNTTVINISELSSAIKNSLFKVILTPSNNNTYFNLILTCASEIFASNLEITSLEEQNINLTDTNFNRSLDSSSYDHEIYAGVSILATNLLKINSNNYIAITYHATKLNGENFAYTKMYLFNLSLFGTGSTFEAKTVISNSITKYLTVSATGFSYPSNQNIEYIALTYEEEFEVTNYRVSNPVIKVNYFNEENYVYAKTIKNTGIFNSPWNSTPSASIESNTDVVIVGEGEITNQNYTIEDYKYCLYTNNKNNYLGFIKTENLAQKEQIDLNISKYFTVIANTPLYLLPTKITGTKIGMNTTKILTNIKEYSRLELLDSLCGYTADGANFIKVQVNGKEIGFIDANQIQNKNNINIFITNNATIKLDNTIVYLDENDKDTIISILDAGTRVQVNGTRNRKTGLTSITFSDEYGNTFSGYISSDNVNADGWTNLQILGSIFIAVNLGILILIFYFKKKRLITRESKNIIEKTNN